MEEYDEIYGEYGGDAANAAPAQQQPAAQPAAQQQEAVPLGTPPGDTGGDEDAEDFLVTLNEPEAKPAAAADDEFEVRLDDTAAEGPGEPPSGAPPPQQAGGFRYARPGVPPAPRPEAGPRPYMDATSSSAQPAAPWAGGGGGGGRGTLGGGRGLGTRPWRPQFIPLSATALEKDDTLAFPEAAKQGQMIKLPGQTRVTPDEYHEFITLGQGGVYELDMDRVIDAPWKVPGTEMTAFFNYSLTPAKWRAYVRETQQAHAELRMQGSIQLYEPPSSMARDPNMPPELIAALAGKGLTGGSHFGEPRPPSAGQTMRQEAPDAILLLAGNVS